MLWKYASYANTIYGSSINGPMKSDNSGANWTLLSNYPEPSWSGELCVDPNNGDLYTGPRKRNMNRNSKWYISTDEGQSFQDAGISNIGYNYVVRKCVITTDSTMFLATGGGLFRKNQGDSTYTKILSETDIIDNLAIGKINTVAVDPFDRIYVGTGNQHNSTVSQNRLLISSDGGNSFTSYNVNFWINDIDIDQTSGKIYLTLAVSGLVILSP